MSDFEKLTYLVPVVFVVVVLETFQLGELTQTLGDVDPTYYAVAVVLFGLSYLPLTVRWWLLLRDATHDPSLRECFEVVTVSYGLNKVLPANLGDVGRSKLHGWYVDVEEHSVILGIVAFERAVDTVVLSLFVGVVGVSVSYSRVGWLVWPAGVLGSLVVLALLLGTRPSTGDWGHDWIPPAVRQFVTNVAFAYRRLSPTTVRRVGVLSVLRWLVGIGTFHALAISLGLSLSPTLSVLVVGAMSLTAILPLSPGGVGPVETAGTVLLVFNGVAASTAFGLILLQRGFGFLSMGGLGILVYGSRKLPWRSPHSR